MKTYPIFSVLFRRLTGLHVLAPFKTYNTNDGEGLALWETVNERLRRSRVSGMDEAGARFGEPHLIRPRLGQGAFRVLVTDLYRRRCAVTQEQTLPALEAAHIRPYGAVGTHEARNGLLLRRDIHSLLDAGSVTVTPDLRFEVSRRSLNGGTIHLPGRFKDRPDRDRLALRFERFTAVA